jgi:transposase-like protein
MKNSKWDAKKICPKCGAKENQTLQGFTAAGTQRCKCKECGKKYCLDPKSNAYPEEVREQVLRIYYAGASGRGVGKVMRFSKANVYN